MSVLRLIQFTDPHLYGDESETLRGIATLPALKAALTDAQQTSAWPPDVVLVTGDLVQDDPSGYVHIRRVFGHLGMPVLCIPGNHDDPAVMRRELRVDPFTVGGHADFGAWRIVLLLLCGVLHAVQFAPMLNWTARASAMTWDFAALVTGRLVAQAVLIAVAYVVVGKRNLQRAWHRRELKSLLQATPAR